MGARRRTPPASTANIPGKISARAHSQENETGALPDKIAPGAPAKTFPAAPNGKNRALGPSPNERKLGDQRWLDRFLSWSAGYARGGTGQPSAGSGAFRCPHPARRRGRRCRGGRRASLSGAVPAPRALMQAMMRRAGLGDERGEFSAESERGARGTRSRGRGASGRRAEDRTAGDGKAVGLDEHTAMVIAIRTTIGIIRRVPRGYGGQGCVFRRRVG
jgi:hypothetical protein